MIKITEKSKKVSRIITEHLGTDESKIKDLQHYVISKAIENNSYGSKRSVEETVKYALSLKRNWGDKLIPFVAEFLGIPEKEILFGKDDNKPALDQFHYSAYYIPHIKCGIPVGTQIEEQVDIVVNFWENELRKDRKIFVFKAWGDSMKPYVRPGDFVYTVNTTIEDKLLENKAYVIDYRSAAVGEKEGMCKLVSTHDKDHYVFTSINTEGNPPIVIHKSKVRGLYKVFNVQRLVDEEKMGLFFKTKVS